ncbi:MAG TPA: PRC-barrel domain-containing protein [Azospirillum sp.]|nr:PRC-barrel domain-containing protein [Azospirillum sp.]
MRNLLFATTAVALLSLPGTVGAQQPNQGGQPGQQAQPSQTQKNQAKPGEGADIKVQQKPAQITVQQPPPQVIVTQPPPQVNIDQQKPQVTVQQPKPDVNVQQAKPEVTVTQPGKPDVNVVQERVRQETQATSATMPAGQAEQLIGNDVLSSGGQEMGEVENLIIDAQGQIKGLVVQWGGFLGIGDKERVVPWNQVQYDHANDRVVIDMTKEQIQALPQYDGPQSVADMGVDARPLR